MEVYTPEYKLPEKGKGKEERLSLWSKISLLISINSNDYYHDFTDNHYRKPEITNEQKGIEAKEHKTLKALIRKEIKQIFSSDLVLLDDEEVALLLLPLYMTKKKYDIASEDILYLEGTFGYLEFMNQNGWLKEFNEKRKEAIEKFASNILGKLKNTSSY